VTLSLLDRAAGQSLTGIVANDPEQAVDLVDFTDDHGAKSRAIVAMSSSSQATTCPGGRVVVADDVRGRLQPDGQPGQPVLDRRPHPRRGRGTPTASNGSGLKLLACSVDCSPAGDWCRSSGAIGVHRTSISFDRRSRILIVNRPARPDFSPA